jgi:hypothetical protein
MPSIQRETMKEVTVLIQVRYWVMFEGFYRVTLAGIGSSHLLLFTR